jgi:hypothetical protein
VSVSLIGNWRRCLRRRACSRFGSSNANHQFDQAESYANLALDNAETETRFGQLFIWTSPDMKANFDRFANQFQRQVARFEAVVRSELRQ